MAEKEYQSGLEQFFRVVKAPIITEKSVKAKGPSIRDEDGKPSNEYRPTFAFWVDNNANKIEIKNAIENIFNVKVHGVKTITVKGRKYRSRWRKKVYPPKKKALVTLQEGDMIELA